MAKEPVFLVCKSCGHRKSAYRVFRENNLLIPHVRPSVKEVKKLLPKLFCSLCKEKKIEVDMKVDIPQKKYVATSGSVNRIFHRNTCGWMGAVSSGDEIVFESKSSALRQGYAPCRTCRP